MSNNYWNQQQNGNNPSQDNQAPRSGNLLRDYGQQQRPGIQQYSPAQQYSPGSMSPTQGPPSYSPVSPMPPTPTTPRQGQLPEQNEWPSPQSWPSPRRQQRWVSNTVQMVRRWSAGRVPVVPPVDQNPLVLYRPTIPSQPLRSKPWKRSRTLRLAMHMKHRRARLQQARPKAKIIVSSILIALLLLLVISTSSASAFAYKYYQDQLPRLQGLANQQIEQTTRIYDRNGNLLYEAYNQQQGGGRRTAVAYDYLPEVLKNAQIAAEDKTFWTNSGIDPQGILRAATQYGQMGSVQSGGSTITQQVIKNLTGDTSQTLNRKIAEATLAVGLTQQYSKTKILEMYFNISPYGAQNLGVEAAVEDYFHLAAQCDSHFNCVPAVYYLNCDAAHIKQCDPAHCDTSKYCDPLLGLARASLLAGLPQSPSAYDPTFGNVDPATGQKFYLERQQYVLDQMLQLGMQLGSLGPLTQDMVNQAEALTAKMKFSLYNHAYYHGSQHFVQWVIQQLEVQLGARTFLTGGFNIRTTIDYNLEAYVEKAVHRHLDQPEYQKLIGGYGPLNIVNNVNDAAVVVMDARTGEVLAMDGSADYNSSDRRVSGNINMATHGRQPGSAIKPIVYATAFQQGFYPGMVLSDVKTYFPTGSYGSSVVCGTDTIPGNAYCPTDYGGGYSNQNTSIHSATALSRNVPAIKASLYAGVDNVIKTAQRFGITSVNEQQDKNASFALGTSAIPLVQMVGAYQVFANQGVRIPPKSVLDIWDNYGHHLYHFDPAHPGGVQVISPQVAYLMTSILKDEQARAGEFSTDHDLSMWDWTLPDGTHPEVAAKTGTTDSFKDNLTIGYTPDVVVGVWAGNANDEAMNNVIGITGAAPIWHSVIERVMDGGGCNIDGAGILPCGNFNFHFSDRTFPQVGGLVNYCVSSANGLAGSGNCDWMLNGEQPQQSGITGMSSNPKP